MRNNRKDELGMLIEGALEESFSKESPADGVWTNIKLRVQGRRQQPLSSPGHLRHLGEEVMAWGSDIGATARILLASFGAYGNGEEWTERLILGGHPTVSLYYSIHH